MLRKMFNLFSKEKEEKEPEVPPLHIEYTKGDPENYPIPLINKFKEQLWTRLHIREAIEQNVTISQIFHEKSNILCNETTENFIDNEITKIEESILTNLKKTLWEKHEQDFLNLIKNKYETSCQNELIDKLINYFSGDTFNLKNIIIDALKTKNIHTIQDEIKKIKNTPDPKGELKNVTDYIKRKLSENSFNNIYQQIIDIIKHFDPFLTNLLPFLNSYLSENRNLEYTDKNILRNVFINDDINRLWEQFNKNTIEPLFPSVIEATLKNYTYEFDRKNTDIITPDMQQAFEEHVRQSVSIKQHGVNWKEDLKEHMKKFFPLQTQENTDVEATKIIQKEHTDIKQKFQTTSVHPEKILQMTPEALEKKIKEIMESVKQQYVRIVEKGEKSVKILAGRYNHLFKDYKNNEKDIKEVQEDIERILYYIMTIAFHVEHEVHEYLHYLDEGYKNSGIIINSGENCIEKINKKINKEEMKKKYMNIAFDIFDMLLENHSWVPPTSKDIVLYTLPEELIRTILQENFSDIFPENTNFKGDGTEITQEKVKKLIREGRKGPHNLGTMHIEEKFYYTWQEENRQFIKDHREELDEIIKLGQALYDIPAIGVLKEKMKKKNQTPKETESEKAIREEAEAMSVADLEKAIGNLETLLATTEEQLKIALYNRDLLFKRIYLLGKIDIYKTVLEKRKN